MFNLSLCFFLFVANNKIEVMLDINSDNNNSWQKLFNHSLKSRRLE